MGPKIIQWLGMACLSLTGCYFSSSNMGGPKADASFLSESEAEALVQSKLSPYGVRFVYNMKLKREGVAFTADGYDPNMRVGFEYRSHEGGDFKGQKGQSKQGLSRDEIEALRQRQATFREYFLIIPEGPKDRVERVVEQFVEDLYTWGVLSRGRKPADAQPEDAIGDPRQHQQELLPWESPGSLKEKRREMEGKDSMPKGSSPGSGAGMTGSDEEDDKQDESDWEQHKDQNSSDSWRRDVEPEN